MKPKALMGLLLCILTTMLVGTAWALDEAVLTPTPERTVAGLSAAEQEKDKADAEKDFNAAMSVWFKHRYADGEKLLGEFAAKYPDSKWRAEAELHQGCYLTYLGQSANAKPIFERLASEFSDTNIKTKATLRLANIAEREAKTDDAITQYTKILRMNPTWDQFKYANYHARKLAMTRGRQQARINCGPIALAACLDALARKSEAAIARDIKPTDEGMSLGVLEAQCKMYGVSARSVEMTLGERYTYDPAGNRLSIEIVGTGTTYYTYYADSDKVQTIGSTSFAYDDAGNTITETEGGTAINYSYNHLNRLTGITGGGNSVSLIYSGYGTLAVENQVSVIEDPAVVSGQALLHEVGQDGAIQKTFVRDGLHLISITTDGTTYTAHCDAIGNIVAVTDSTGSVVGTQVFDAYGNRIAALGDVPDAYGYAGRYGYRSIASNGLLLLTTRAYSTEYGRFLSLDPARYGNNYYEYAMNRPTVMIDPLGLFPGLTGCAIGGVIGGIGSWIGGGTTGENICNGVLGCALGGLTEVVLEIFPELGFSQQCLMGLVGGVTGGVGSQICSSIFGKCPKPLNWKCMAAGAVTGLIGGCAGHFLDDDTAGKLIDIVGQFLGLDLALACDNDFPVKW